MMVPRCASDVLAEHVVFEVECVDRMYCNLFVPRLQTAEGVAGFLHARLGARLASTALLNPRRLAFTAQVSRFAEARGAPLVHFRPGERKDDVTRGFLSRFGGREGLLYVGIAQEKTRIFRTEKRRAANGGTYPWIVPGTGVVNQVYFYFVDGDFGPGFLKLNTYFPHNGKLCLNGHHWAQRQAAKAGIGFTALDNGFASCEDPARLQAICDRLGPADVQGLTDKWLRVLPRPFDDDDRAAGFAHAISVLQLECSLTQVLDSPVAGRVLFEDLIRDNLDAGRPDRVSIIFDKQIRRRGKNRTPGPFRTRVITEGVIPSLHIDYKSNKIKQYHKEGRALRTETTINNPRDFKTGKLLCNLPALREIGLTANRRLLGVQQISGDPVNGTRALAAVCEAVTTPTGTRVPGLRLGDPRALALLQSLLTFGFIVHGFTHHDLRRALAQLLGKDPSSLSTGMISYDLRRLRAHGLIDRVPGTHRYQVTDTGTRYALFLAKLQARLIPQGLTELLDQNSPQPTALARAHKAYDKALHHLCAQNRIASAA